MKNYLINNYIAHWGRIHGEPLHVEELSPYELIVETETGYTVLYNDQDNMLRNLPKDSNCMSEEECRREFKYQLRKQLSLKDMSQLELSEITGIPQPVLSGYMNGKNLPGFYNLDKIAKALNCSTDEFRYTYKK